MKMKELHANFKTVLSRWLKCVCSSKEISVRCVSIASLPSPKKKVAIMRSFNPAGSDGGGGPCKVAPSAGSYAKQKQKFGQPWGNSD